MPSDIRISLDYLRALALAALLVVVGWWVIGLLYGILVIFALAAIVAFVLSPLVDLIDARLGIPRGLAAIASYLVLALVCGGVGALLAQPLIAQLRQLVEIAPTLLRDLSSPTAPWIELARNAGVTADLSTVLTALSAQIQSSWDDIARQGFAVAQGVGGAAVDTLLVFVIAFHMLTGRHTLRNLVRPFVSSEHEPTIARIESRVGDILGRYLRARLLLSTIVGVLVFLAALVFALPFPIILGLVAAIFDLVPFVGPVIGALPAIAVALAEGPPLRALAVLIAFVVIQQVEGNILAPKLMSDAVHTSPLVVIFAVLVGAEFGGVWGALLAAPVAGSVGAIVQVLTAPPGLPVSPGASEEVAADGKPARVAAGRENG